VTQEELRQAFEAQGIAAIPAAFSNAPVEAARAVGAWIRDLYWIDHDLATVTLIGSLSLVAGLAAAPRLNESQRYDLLSQVKAIAYDIGSFTWPGWGEAGISPGSTDLQAGRHAARLNLRLAEELQKGDLPLARAHWLCGAQEIAAGAYESAVRYFEAAAAHAERAGAEAEQRLAEGFAALVVVGTSAPDSPAAAVACQKLAGALVGLGGLENGTDFQAQIVTAAKVFEWDILGVK